MAHVGCRAEVYWPPEQEDMDGQWYCGQLDSYDDQEGYHVTYDDGDQELLGEVDGRDDVRLIGTAADEDGGPHEWKVRKPSDNDLDAGVPTTTIGRTTPTEIPRAETLCHRDDDHEASPTLSKSGQRSGQNAGEYPRESPKEFPLHSSQKHCSDESLILGRDGSLARFQTTPDTDNESIDNRRHEGELYIREGEVDLAAASYREIERAPSPLIPGNSDRNHYSGDLDGSVSGDEGNFNGYKPTRHNDVDAVVENASPRRCNNYDGGSSNNLNDYGESDHVHNRFDLRETVGTEDSRTLSMDGSSVRSDGTYADNGDGTLSLSGDSTEWTPLRGSRYLGRLKGNEPGDWTVRFADEQSQDGSLSSPVPVRQRAEMDRMVSTLRDAVNTSVTGLQRGVNEKVRQSETIMHNSAGASANGVGEVSEGCGSEGLKDLGKLVEEKAVLTGAVDGVDEISGDGSGIFVKISFIDGAGGAGVSSSENAMFRCKRHLHTTGAAACSSGGNIGCGWEGGDFKCETFHGGHLEELANASVLFSAHRRGSRSGGTGLASNSGDISRSHSARVGERTTRDIFLGQVTLRLRTLVTNLSLVTEDHSSRRSDVPGVQSKGGDTTNHAQGGDCGSWQSLHAELSGSFPTTSRGCKTSTRADEGMRLRLRLAIWVPLKKQQSGRGDSDLPSPVTTKPLYRGVSKKAKEGMLRSRRRTGTPTENPLATASSGRGPYARNHHSNTTSCARSSDPGGSYDEEFQHPMSITTYGAPCATLGVHRNSTCVSSLEGPETGIRHTVGARTSSEGTVAKYGGSSGGGDIGVKSGAIDRPAKTKQAVVERAKKIGVGGVIAGNGKEAIRGGIVRNSRTPEKNAPVRRPQHEAPALRQRIRRQQEIARENERIDRRLRDILDASPRKCHAEKKRVSYDAPRRWQVEQRQKLQRQQQQQQQQRQRQQHQRKQRQGYDNACFLQEPSAYSGRKIGSPGDDEFIRTPGDHRFPIGLRSHSRNDNSRQSAEADRKLDGDMRSTAAIAATKAGGKDGEGAWRDIYLEREALAGEVETEAKKTANLRSRVEALRAKTMWTEANARSASLAAAAVRKSLESPATSLSRATAIPTAGSASGKRTVTRVFDSASVLENGGLEGNMDGDLFADLGRQEKLYQALLEKRRKVIVRGEEFRRRQETDLKMLDDVKAQLAQAEDRQEKCRPRTEDNQGTIQQHRSTAAAVKSNADFGDVTEAKDPLDSARDLALSLRVEVETLRLKDAMGRGRGGKSRQDGEADEDRETTDDGRSRAVRDAEEEVKKLQLRLSTKRTRLEKACLERNATRAEYQASTGGGLRSALKESIAWIEHAKLQLETHSKPFETKML